MIKKLLLIGSVTVMAGVAALVGAKNRIEVLAGSGDSAYYFTGEISGKDGTWGNKVIADLDSDDDNLMVATSVSLKAGDVFKFAKNKNDTDSTDWDSAKGAGDIVGGNAVGYFAATGKTKNILVLEDGTYDFYLNNSGQITINGTPTASTATYSYVVSYDSNHTNFNAWSGDSFWTEFKPSFAQIGSYSFGGIGLSREYDSNKYNFWAIYKIDDRVLTNFSKFNLFHGGSYSTEMTVGGNQSVYFENKETSDDSNVYAAVEFLFNLGYARNSYSYTNENSVTHNYGASTCAVLSAGTASTFINDYDTIHGTLSGAGVLDNAGMFVYDVDNGKVSDDLSKNVAISVIVNELRKHVSNNQTPIQGASIAITNGTDTTTVALVVTVATAVVMGSFFFLRKKKEQ